MGEALFELEQALTSHQEKLTPQEANVLLTCKSKAVRAFTSGAIFGGGAGCLKSSWQQDGYIVIYVGSHSLPSTTAAFVIISGRLAATWNLSKIARVNLSGGAALSLGLWSFARSLDSCLDHILSLDGSRMQKELANIIVNKYQDDPWTMQHVNRHFYTEKVFDDSSSDKPILRFRYRNFFGDNVANGQRTHDSNSHNDSDSEKPNVESKQVPMNPGANMMEDPLDSILGYMAPMEEIHHPGTSSTPARAVAHRHNRRSHRKRRMHHHEVSLNLKHPQSHV